MMSRNDGGSTWSLQQGVNFETAQEVLAQLIALAGRKVSAARENGDDSEAAHWEGRRAEWSSRRLSLSPTDTTAVQAVLADDADVLRTLQQGS